MLLDLLWRYGARKYDKHGAEIVYFDSRARKRVHAYTGGALAKLSEQLNSYAILEGDTVVTVGHRYKNIRNA